ncbi:MAG TPA: hypothetical protein VEB64_05905 [Azospirillaceae bacterium]|nr:hypothetical protein [Azospirillaceae bacterium]
MAVAGKITYIVHTRTGRSWSEKGRTGNMDSALNAADKLFSSKKFKGVKVDKEFADPSQGRLVVTTIFDKKAAQRRNIIPLLLLLSVTMGVAAYFLTTVAIRQYL